jgi:alpha-beta hydrolase superfamily lysophospholipase
MKKTIAAHLTLAASATLLALSSFCAHAVENGPAPTEDTLSAAAGSYAVANAKVATPSGYGAGTVYYPTAAGSYGLVVLAPGFTATQVYYTWLAQRVASHGFVVVNINTKTVLDQPESRATQMAAALKQVVALSKTAGTPFVGKVDETRQAVMGHSMGGGGTLAAARDNANLKAAVPLTPWHTTKDFSGVKVPTLIVACEKDTIAPNASHSNKFYSSLKVSLNRGKVEIAGADHFCATSLANAATQTIVARNAIAWLKRFVDGDTRYQSLIQGTAGSIYSAVDIQLN